MATIGAEICAILKADERKVHLIGYGKYVGDEIPDEHCGGFGGTLREHCIKNPKLVLEDGTVVWGCECWWGDAEKAHKHIGNREVIRVDMRAERAKHG